MSAHETAAPQRAARPPAPGEPRLVIRDKPLSLAEHLDHYGPVPLHALSATTLIGEVDQSGLTGRGGGAFPAGRKLRAVAEAGSRSGRGGTVVVANGSESEPASSKDGVLLSRSPHLVLDGIALCARAVGAGEARLCIGRAVTGLAGSLAAALAEREHAGLTEVPVQVTATPPGYLSGQETALISALNGGAPRPTFVPPRPAERGARRRPTLVLNVETLAHIALIGRFGSRWYRSAGTSGAPGTALVTVSGAVGRPGVREVPLGTPLGEVLRRCDLLQPAQAVLTGGYFGAWLPLPAAAEVPVTPEGLRAAGGALGAGVLGVLPADACGLAETARLTAFLADQSAEQCGPCRNGLPALAEALDWIAFGRAGPEIAGRAQELTRLISGRGACHLPDGAALLVRSALSAFAADLRVHAEYGPCTAAGRPAIFPVPGPGWE